MKPFWKPARKGREAVVLAPRSGHIVSAHIPRSSSQVTLSAINPFVGQLIAQAEALQAVSSQVERIVGRECVTALMATRDHADRGSSSATARTMTLPIVPQRDVYPAFRTAEPMIARPHLVVTTTEEPRVSPTVIRESEVAVPTPLAQKSVEPTTFAQEAVAPVQEAISPVADDFFDMEEALETRGEMMTDAISKLTNHYVKRFLSETKLPETAVEPIAESVGAPMPIFADTASARSMGSSLVAFSHDSFEIPKVPPYVWPATLPVVIEHDDALSSWFNCLGNRFQLSLDMDAATNHASAF